MSTAIDTPATDTDAQAQAAAPAVDAGQTAEAEAQAPATEAKQAPASTDPWDTDSPEDAAAAAMAFLNGEQVSGDDFLGDDAPARQEPDPKPAEQAPAANPEATAPETPAEDAAQGDEGEPLVKRFNTGAFDERERRIMDFMARNRDDKPTIEDAIAYVDERFPRLRPEYPVPGVPGQPPAAQGESGQPSTPAEALARLDETIAAKEAELDQAAEEYDAPGQARLVKELRKLDRERMALELEARESRQVETTEIFKAIDESIDRAAVRYPQSREIGSEFHTALAMEVARLEKDDPGYFQRVADWPEELTDRVGRRLGVPPALASAAGESAPPAASAAQPSAPAPQAGRIPPAPARVVRPVAPAVSTPGTAPAPAPTREAELQAIRETSDPAALFDTLNRLGTRKVG